MIDRILYNARLYGNSQAPALAISGERIAALGSDDEIKALANAQTQMDNAEGRFVLPGLWDAHIHWENTAKARHAVDLWSVPSKAEALRRIKTRIESLQPGEWVYGSGWLQDLWDDNQRRFPDKTDLDSVTGDSPAYLIAKSGHAAWVNSAALRLAGITANTPDPAGGKIGRNADGSPNGILFEYPAMQMAARHIPSIPTERLADWMREAQEDAWRCGLVGLHDFDNPSCLLALQRLRERGELGLRVVKQVNKEWINHAYELGIRSGFGDDWLRIGALKIFADGSLGARTALMIAPYEGEPDNYGVSVTDKESMYELVSAASKNGFHSSIHAIGDRAVHDVLDVFAAVRAEEAENGIPRGARRHRIEHVQVIHPDDANRLGELDIIASMQPFHMASDWQMADRFWGERARYSYDWRTQLNAGAVLAFGSDAPIDPFEPLKGIYTAVTRRDLTGSPGADGWYPEGRLTAQEAVHAYTHGAAYTTSMENRSGKLAAGYLADLVMLDHDVTAIAPDEILDVSVLGTMVGGTWRYRNF